MSNRLRMTDPERVVDGIQMAAVALRDALAGVGDDLRHAAVRRTVLRGHVATLDRMLGNLVEDLDVLPSTDPAMVECDVQSRRAWHAWVDGLDMSAYKP